MVNKTPLRLDKKDRLIMQQLENDSRQSYSEIGRRVGLGGETVEYRMRKLLESGIIMRMFAEPNLPKLGLKTYRVYLKIENMPSEDEEKMVRYFIEHPKSHWFAEFEGEWDYTLRYTLADEIEFREEIEDLLRRFGKYIIAKNIVITLQQSYLPLTYFTGRESRIRWISLERAERIEELDDADREIMRLLFDNSRASTIGIASKTGLSADAVQYRIRKLVRSGVISFFGIYYDSSVLGYGRYKVLLWLRHSTKKREEELIHYCQQHPNSSYLNRVVGSWDLEVDFDTKTVQGIHDIVKDLRSRFGDIIRDHSTMITLREQLSNPFQQVRKRHARR